MYLGYTKPKKQQDLNDIPDFNIAGNFSFTTNDYKNNLRRDVPVPQRSYSNNNFINYNDVMDIFDVD